jgi:hypothetical protein
MLKENVDVVVLLLLEDQTMFTALIIVLQSIEQENEENGLMEKLAH